MRFLLPALLLCGSLASCASIVSGSSQGLTVKTSPADATCELRKEGELIGAVNPTPGTVQVKRGTADLTVECKKNGYETAIQKVDSEFNAWYIGNLLFGGIIGLIVDPITGAWQKYPESTSVTLTEKPLPLPAAAGSSVIGPAVGMTGAPQS